MRRVIWHMGGSLFGLCVPLHPLLHWLNVLSNHVESIEAQVTWKMTKLS